MIRLTAVIEYDEGRRQAIAHESDDAVVSIGRDEGVDFRIPLATVSRQHARITRIDGLYFIEDLGSAHGTLVNGRKLDPQERSKLSDGDMVELTKAVITCNIEAPELAVDEAEMTQAIAFRAVEGLLGKLDDASKELPFLRVLNAEDEGRKFELEPALSEWHLGRSKACQFVLSNPNISRKHAVIHRDWRGFTIEDAGSRSGILVNGTEVAGTHRLVDRDEVSLGPVKLLFIDPDQELVAALKDVPGFDLDDGPSRVDIPAAPVEESNSAERDGAAELGMEIPGEDDPAHLEVPSTEASSDDSAWASDIDPSLLEPETGRKKVDTLVLLGVTALLGLVLLLVFAFLT